MSSIKPTSSIDDLDIPASAKRKLHNLEISNVRDLSATDYSVIHEAVGHGTGSILLKFIVSAGLKPKLREPDWSDKQWKNFVEKLVEDGLVDWKEIALAICGELNPPQVGTAVASNPSFQRHYPARQTMKAVMEWFYAQNGRCAICGTRLFLEGDHIEAKEAFLAKGKAAEDADTLENLQLLCKRCNVIKRPSHALGGLSFGPAQAVLIWILLVEKPRSFAAFCKLCREHGLTMASIRFQEAWAFALWLSKEGRYQLD